MYRGWTLLSIDQVCMVSTIPCKHNVTIQSPDKSQIVSIPMSAPDIKNLVYSSEIVVPSHLINETRRGKSYKGWTLISASEMCMKTIPHCQHEIIMQSPDGSQIKTIRMDAPQINEFYRVNNLVVPRHFTIGTDPDSQLDSRTVCIII